MGHARRLCRLQRNPAHRSGIWIDPSYQAVSSRRTVPEEQSERWRLKFWDDIARQVLSYAIGTPNALDNAAKDLAGVKIERNFDPLTVLHVFEIFLEEFCEQVAIRIRRARMVA